MTNRGSDSDLDRDLGQRQHSATADVPIARSSGGPAMIAVVQVPRKDLYPRGGRSSIRQSASIELVATQLRGISFFEDPEAPLGCYF